MNKPEISAYRELIDRIGQVLEQGRQATGYAVNYHMVLTYWEIGHYIVQYEQHGEVRAEYGKKLLIKLAKDLRLQFGKGMSRSNLTYMRQCYLEYEKIQTVNGKFILQQRQEKCETLSHISTGISETVSDILSWSHYFELLKVQDKMERNFYEKQCFNEKWSIRELKRQINSGLFQRLALSKDKAGILALAKQGQQLRSPADVVKDPYVFEFLNLPERGFYRESDLEQALIDKLQLFLLAATKDDIMVEYAMGNLNAQMFVSTYQLYLPDKEELKEQLTRILHA